MKGRKPLPPHLKIIRGTFRPKKQPPPKPTIGEMPTPPDFLCEQALAEWHRQVPTLHKRGIVNALDRAILAAYCTAYARWISAEAVLAQMARDDETGMGGSISVNPKTGRQVAHPMAAISRAAARDVARLAAEIGLTPTARLRIGVEPPPDDDPSSKYLT